MHRKITLFIVLLVSITFANAQTNPTILKGTIIDFTTKEPLSRAHILNLNSVEGTTTNGFGNFAIPATANDTLLISFIGYQSVKLKITNDILKGNELEIAIHQKRVQIDEVTVKAHNLIGVLVVDAKNVPEDKYKRIHIEGLPQTYEIGKPKAKEYTGVGAAIFNPVDFWYNKFGKKPRELRKLKKIKEEDRLRDLMDVDFSREVLMSYMDMSKKELDELLAGCNYSNNFVKTASDLQIIEAVIDCYENYRALQKGQVSKEKISVKDTVKN